MYKVAFPEYLDIFSPQSKEKLQTVYGITFYNDSPKTEEKIIKRIGDAEVVIIKWLHFTDELIEKLPNITYIITLTAGYNQLPIKKATELGIKVINCPTHNSNAVVEHVFALLLSLCRAIVEANMHMKKREWKHTSTDFEGIELTGKKLLLIGNGRIAKGVEHIADSFGMRVVTTDSKTSKEAIDKFIKEADVISLHVPLTEVTRHMIDERRLGLMKKSASIINTSRGEVIDQKALLEALKEKRIAGAGLDVFENEPETSPLPEEIIKLITLPNVVATPHIAYSTKESAYRLGEELLSNLENLTKGNPINVVN